MGIFDIIGPVMIGPSSSHTAGAARLGKLARTILGEKPLRAEIKLFGSFAKTYKGHGTDKALIAGLLDMAADDAGIKDAFSYALKDGLQFSFVVCESGGTHPNTAEFALTGVNGKKVRITGISTGGGNVTVNRIDDYQVEISGEYFTLITVHQDKPGIIALVTQVLANDGVNIAFMRVSRNQRGLRALMIVETDQQISARALKEINALAPIESALTIQPL